VQGSALKNQGNLLTITAHIVFPTWADLVAAGADANARTP
jgi:hypothetical protein